MKTKLMSYKQFLASFNEETVASDVASTETKLGGKKSKVLKKKKPCKTKIQEGAERPEDILRKNNIKIKSTEMDDESYVILLYKDSDTELSKEILEKSGYEVSIVGKLLYIS